MSSITPSATFALSSAAPHSTAAINLSEALARATHADLQNALVILNDELLGTLSAFADAICQNRSVMQ